jgi:gliding motility-associated-like protein
MPNAFSPDGDGENDYFFPRQYLSQGVIAFSMNIFNRWGQKVFETTSTTGRGWDGRFNDKEQPMGVYIYNITVKYKNGRDEKYTGNVTLIR